jgi:hypothetical protein
MAFLVEEKEFGEGLRNLPFKVRDLLVRFFLQYWNLDSEPCAGQAGDLPLPRKRSLVIESMKLERCDNEDMQRCRKRVSDRLNKREIHN